MNDELIAAVARRTVRDCAQSQAGESVSVEGRVDSAQYLELRACECEPGCAPTVLDAVREVPITSAKGADLRLRLEERPLDKDVGLATGEMPFTNQPAGELAV